MFELNQLSILLQVTLDVSRKWAVLFLPFDISKSHSVCFRNDLTALSRNQHHLMFLLDKKETRGHSFKLPTLQQGIISFYGI